MGNYVSPFSSPGSSGGGGGTATVRGGGGRMVSSGYTSPRMAGYTSPFATKNYNGLEPPDPMKSGFSVGNKQYKNVDDYTAQFDKLSPQDRLAQYQGLKAAGGSNPVAQGIVSHLDSNGRTQTTPQKNPLQVAGDFIGGMANSVKNDAVNTWNGIGNVVQGQVAANKLDQKTQLMNDRTQQWQKQFGNASDKQWADPAFQQKAKDFSNQTKQLLSQWDQQNNITDINNKMQASQKVDAKKTALAAASTFLNATGVYGLAEGAVKGVATQGAKMLGEQVANQGAKALVKAGGTDALETAIKTGGETAAGGGKVAATNAVKTVAAPVVKTLGQKVATSAGENALFGGGYGAIEGAKGSNQPGDIIKGAVEGTVGGGLFGAGAAALGHGAGALLDKMVATPSKDALAVVKNAAEAGGVKTTPAADQAFQNGVDNLKASYQSEMQAAGQQKGALAQSIAVEHVNQSHAANLEQLVQDYQSGKLNDGAAPAPGGSTTGGAGATGDVTPTTTPSKTMAANATKGPSITLKMPTQHTPVVATDPMAQVHQRIAQIDSIIQGVQNGGQNRSAEEMQSLMREKQAAEGIVNGTHSYQEVYGNPNAKIQPLPFGDLPTSHKPGFTMPTKDTPVTPGGSMITSLPKVEAGDTKAAQLHRGFIASKYEELGQAIQDAKKGMTPHDIKLIESIESSTPMTAAEAANRVTEIAHTADNPAKFLKAVQALKDFADARLANDIALGRDVGQRQNYLSRFYQRGTTAQSKALDRLNLTGDSLPGYTKERSIATQAEADALAAQKNPDGTPKYPQLQRANANVFEDAKQAVDMAKADHGKQAMKLALEQAHPGVKVGVNKIGFDPESGLTYKGLDTKGGNGLSLPKYLADAYNKRAPISMKQNFGIKLPDGSIKPVNDNELVQQLKANPGSKLVDPVSGKSLMNWKVNKMVRSAVKDPLGAYDTVNANLKYSILGGGTFHAITTGGTVAGQQTMRALTHPLEIPSMIGQNLRLVASTVSQKSHDAVMAAHEADGSLSFAKLVGTTLNPKDILGDAHTNWSDKLKESKWNPIKQVHDAVFARQIPEAKMMIMKQSMMSKFKGMDFNNPTQEQIQYGRKVASAVNNIGGINRAVEGLSPKTAKQLSRVLLATDFTEGKMRIMANALTKGGPQGNIARQMVVGKSVLFALPGLAAMTASGTLNWSNPDQVRKAITDQILDPSIPLPGEKSAPTKSNPGGTQQAIHFPSTFISEFGKIVKPALDPLAPNKAQGLIDYATNRVAALPGVVSRLAQNKDFSGNSIYGQDKQGNDISPGQTALNIGNQVLPIPVVQGGKQATGQQNLRDTLLNVAGMRVSSDPNSDTGQHTQAIKDFYNTLNQASAEHTKVSKQISAALAANNPAQAYRLANDYNQSLPQRLQPFQQKYADHYNPAWDQEFKKLQIPLSASSFRARQKSNDLQSRILDPNY